MKITETDRLSLRWFTLDDAPFIVNLLNEPGWLRYIGDRGIDTEADARAYIETMLIASYRKYGYGLYAVELKDDNSIIGMCGLVKRDWLDDADIGFAVCARYEGRGYGTEAALAVLEYARDSHALRRILAITAGDNDRSKSLLKRLGMVYQSTISPPGEAGLVELYSINN